MQPQTHRNCWIMPNLSEAKNLGKFKFDRGNLIIISRIKKQTRLRKCVLTQFFSFIQSSHNSCEKCILYLMFITYDSIYSKNAYEDSQNIFCTNLNIFRLLKYILIFILIDKRDFWLASEVKWDKVAFDKGLDQS